MIWVDYVILAILGVSAAISLLRGFVREALSLVGWIAAFWIALTFSDRVAVLLEGQISVPSLREAVGFVALFVGVLIATAVVVYLAGLLVEQTGMSGTDRMLGMVFGLARGAIIVGILVLLAGLTALPRDPWWRESTFLPHFQKAAVEIRELLPPDIAGKLEYGP